MTDEEMIKKLEEGGWKYFKGRIQKLRRVVIRRNIADELGVDQGDLVEVLVRKYKPKV